MLLVVPAILAGLASTAGGPPAHARGITGFLGHASVRGLEGRTSTVRIFLVAVGDDGRSGPKIGCGDSLIAVSRRIAPTTAPLTAALNLLLSLHDRYYGQSGLYNALYRSHLRVQKASVVKGTATVRLVGTMSLGGVCDDPRVGAQLRHTVRQFPTVRRVAIFINNVPLWKRLSQR